MYTYLQFWLKSVLYLGTYSHVWNLYADIFRYQELQDLSVALLSLIRSDLSERALNEKNGPLIGKLM